MAPGNEKQATENKSSRQSVKVAVWKSGSGDDIEE
jgi:hypothetical protein